jgi:hypothetical protein
MGRGGRRKYIPPEQVRERELKVMLEGQETNETQFRLEGETRNMYRRRRSVVPGKMRAKFPADGFGQDAFVFVSVSNNSQGVGLELICGTEEEVRAAPLFPVEWHRFDSGFFQNPGDDAGDAETARGLSVSKATRKPEEGAELVVLDVETDALPVSAEHYSQHEGQVVPSELPPRRARGHQLSNWQPGVSLLWCGYLFEISEQPFDDNEAAADGDASSPSAARRPLEDALRGPDEEQRGPARFLRVRRQAAMVKSAGKT